jgi:predicted methyltransferase
MNTALRTLALALLLLAAPPLAAAPSDYAAAVSSPARDARDRALDAGRMPAEVLDFAGIARGQVVVDYFSGTGYYAEMIATAVGRQGTVYALNPTAFHQPSDFAARTARHRNLRVMTGEVPTLQLAPASVDLLFNHLNYHDLYWQSERFKFNRLDVPQVLAHWFSMVKPGGHVVLIDHAGPAGDPRDVVERLHRIDPERVKADMAAAGFILVAESNLLHRSDDGLDKGVFDAAIRGRTSRFMLKFRRP